MFFGNVPAVFSYQPSDLRRLHRNQALTAQRGVRLDLRETPSQNPPKQPAVGSELSSRRRKD